MAEATAKERKQKQDDKQSKNHGSFSSFAASYGNPYASDCSAARARTAWEKHSIGGLTRPAPIWPTPARREAMPVLIWGRMPVWSTIRTSIPVGVPRKLNIGSV